MIPSVGPLEIGIVLVIALVVFGPKRLPELGNSLGRGIRSFRGAVTENGLVEPGGERREEEAQRPGA